MKLCADDIHSLAAIALDPRGEFSDQLMETLAGDPRVVGQGLRGEKSPDDLNPILRSAVMAFQNWANPPS